MKAKIVTAYWMDVEGYPFQGTRQSLKTRYLGSLINHCKGIDLPIICYTHSKNKKELLDLKNEYKLDNLSCTDSDFSSYVKYLLFDNSIHSIYLL